MKSCGPEGGEERGGERGKERGKRRTGLRSERAPDSTDRMTTEEANPLIPAAQDPGDKDAAFGKGVEHGLPPSPKPGCSRRFLPIPSFTLNVSVCLLPIQ